MRFYPQFILTISLFSLLVSCNNGADNRAVNASDSLAVVEEKSPAMPMFSTYSEAIIAMRGHKDESMVKNGIIEKSQVASFKGLKYFAPDSSYIFKAKIELLNPEKVVFKTTDSRAPEYYKFCKLHFSKDGKACFLYGYVEDPKLPKSLFIPFKDLTSNKESYGGGRYMDIDYHGEKTLLLLDFNYAYNPYCHYNHDYSCPLVPVENILAIAIKAGEKKLNE